MKKLLVLLLSIGATASWAQLSTDQKVEDFQSLVSLYAKQYAPAGWKNQLFHYDLFNIDPWLEKVRKSGTDLEFLEVMGEYVAALNDAHSIYFNASDFVADLRIRTDIYEGKVLIDAIDRAALPAAKFPFVVGDELVSVDNRGVNDLIADFSRFFSDANPLSTGRDAAGLIPFRIQQIIPRSVELGDTSTVVIRRQSGNLETYTIPWVKSGTPIIKVGPVPTPHGTVRADTLPGDATPDPEAFLHPLRYLQRMHLPTKKMVLNFDGVGPIFALPSTFKQRLGRRSSDFFFTGTYTSGGKTIGFIRIYDFDVFGDFNNIPAAEDSFDSELAFMKANTDGLVVDIMRNPGGFGCYAEDLMSRFATKPFYALNLQFRPTIFDVQGFTQSVQDAIDFGAEDWVVATLKAYLAEINQAYSGGGMTGPLPACGITTTRNPNQDANGQRFIYDKPVLLLTDEFSASSADIFAALFQDAQRGQIFGMRTMGAGGSVSDGNPAGYYSEGFAAVTQTMVVRANPVVTPDYPTAPFIENIGVRPDIKNDYMTVSNLKNRGADFVTAFNTAILATIGK
ncbi:MAG TPA: S41 family peptidase [Bryobacteraceae bacterium]|nr:S41 family peptidase [Bryobacteraceae bacterium]